MLLRQSRPLSQRRAVLAASTDASKDAPVAPPLKSKSMRGTYSRLRGLAYEERHRLGAGVALSAFTSGLTLVWPKAIGNMIDRITSTSNGGAAGSGAGGGPAASGNSSSPSDGAPSQPSTEAVHVVTGDPSDAPSAADSTADWLAAVPDWVATDWATVVDVAAWTPGGIGLGLMGVAALQAAASVARANLLTQSGEAIACRIRERALRNLLDQELAFYDRQDSGELVSGGARTRGQGWFDVNDD
jgi:ABC-type multidrug transport system fused ATPase/permease subunit